MVQMQCVAPKLSPSQKRRCPPTRLPLCNERNPAVAWVAPDENPTFAARGEMMRCVPRYCCLALRPHNVTSGFNERVKTWLKVGLQTLQHAGCVTKRVPCCAASLVRGYHQGR